MDDTFTANSDAGSANLIVDAAPTQPLVETPKPSLFDRAKAMFTSKAELQNEIASFQGQVSDYKTQLERANENILDLEQQLGSIKEANAKYADEQAKLTKLIDQLETEKQTVSTGVVDALSSIGVPEVSLPAAAVDGIVSKQDQIAEITQQINASTDSIEKGRLVQKLRKLRQS